MSSISSFHSACKNQRFLWVMYFDDLIYCVYLFQAHVQSTWAGPEFLCYRLDSISQIGNNPAVRMLSQEHHWHLGMTIKIWSCIGIISFYFPQTSAFLSLFYLIPIVGMGLCLICMGCINAEMNQKAG